MSRNMKYLLLSAIVVILAFFFLTLRNRAEATNIQIQQPKVDVCHFDGQSGNFQTLNIALAGAIAHLAQHDEDYPGACKEPVDVCDNLEGIQEVTPEGYTNDDGYCCPPKEEPKDCIPYNEVTVLGEGEEYCEPEVTPTPTPEQPKGNPSDESFAPSSTQPSTCGIHDIGDVANINVEVGVPNDGKLTVQWSLPENANAVHILYRQYDEDWKYALLNTPNDGSEEIGGLKNGVNYAFKVAGVRDCGVGLWSKEYDPQP